MMPITWNNVADRLKMCYTAKLHPQMRLAAFFHAMSSILIFTVYLSEKTTVPLLRLGTGAIKGDGRRSATLLDV